MFTTRSAQTAPIGRHHADDKGLYLEVTKNGTRRWLYRFTSPITHKPTEAGLGVFPQISLAKARAKAAEYRALVADGQDPISLKREARAATKAAQKPVPTLGTALAAYVDAFKDKGDPTQQVKLTLERHTGPLLSCPIATVTTNDVLQVLVPIQARLPKTAARVRACLSVLFNYAIARGMMSGGDPASAAVFKYLMPPPPASTPHRMMPFALVPSFFARLQEQVTAPRLCLLWLILTASRSQEAIRCEWSEIDLEQRLWTVPPDKIKMRRVHRVPISTPALAVLEQARQLGDDRYVFPGLTLGSPMNRRILESVMHKQMGEPYAVHGLRASFSSWAGETQPFAFEDVEACLAHQIGNAVSRAYDRAERLAKRAAVLEAWGSFVAGAAGSNVVRFIAKAST
jgi:integrase